MSYVPLVPLRYGNVKNTADRTMCFKILESWLPAYRLNVRYQEFGPLLRTTYPDKAPLMSADSLKVYQIVNP